MPRRREGRDLPEIVMRLFAEARAQFPDPRAVNRTLLELSRFYDPVSGGVILEHATRRRIVELLEKGQTEEASRALEERFEEYSRSFKPGDEK
ncbi:MAG: hypothetical protein XU13_C0130G0003 [Candidatus Rokubacteria bacterium CSP1-6]|jgi:predicted ATP-grasp superfamily ATP-dependent carboligase|nr:MAG: hypothetical protein XU13_C0130G0003 [Candidatus Rokubacteria bacterium CSP1-6]